MTGQHIQIFLVDGIAGGITTTEIVGWTGHVLFGPRSNLGELLKRPEAARNGVYLLLGDDVSALGGVRCYIGRTESFRDRFGTHKGDASKDFFDRVVLIAARDDSIAEGHWGYLEARIVDLAKQAKRVDVDNTQTPQGRKLSEAQVSDMEAFIDHLHVILPVLGIDAIKVRVHPGVATDLAERSPLFELKNAKRGVVARGQQVGGEFLMLEGSTIVGSWSGVGSTASTERAYAALREKHAQLIADGSIEVNGAIGRLTRDIPFRSPSGAGALALGRSCNGRIEWQAADGQTFGAWEDRGLDASV